jgi:hypothetical protein
MSRRSAWRRDPIREMFRRRTIRPQRRNGLTVRAFCLREGLKDGRLQGGGRRWPVATASPRLSAAPPGWRAHRSDPRLAPVRLPDLEPVRPRRSPSIEMSCCPTSGSPRTHQPARDCGLSRCRGQAGIPARSPAGESEPLAVSVVPGGVNPLWGIYDDMGVFQTMS